MRTRPQTIQYRTIILGMRILFIFIVRFLGYGRSLQPMRTQEISSPESSSSGLGGRVSRAGATPRYGEGGRRTESLVRGAP
jgi:hypothetical protein